MSQHNTALHHRPVWQTRLALCGLVLQTPVIWVCLCLQSETLCKFPLGILRFRSRKWIHDITRSIE